MFRDKRDETRRPNILPVGYKREKMSREKLQEHFLDLRNMSVQIEMTY